MHAFFTFLGDSTAEDQVRFLGSIGMQNKTKQVDRGGGRATNRPETGGVNNILAKSKYEGTKNMTPGNHEMAQWRNVAVAA
jgi:hypothetical protein